MTKRINKPLPYPYDSIFKNEENKEENKIEAIPEKEDKTISASSENSGAYSSALPIAVALLLLNQNNKND